MRVFRLYFLFIHVFIPVFIVFSFLLLVSFIFHVCVCFSSAFVVLSRFYSRFYRLFINFFLFFSFSLICAYFSSSFVANSCFLFPLSLFPRIQSNQFSFIHLIHLFCHPSSIISLINLLLFPFLNSTHFPITCYLFQLPYHSSHSIVSHSHPFQSSTFTKNLPICHICTYTRPRNHIITLLPAPCYLYLAPPAPASPRPPSLKSPISFSIKLFMCYKR